MNNKEIVEMMRGLKHVYPSTLNRDIESVIKHHNLEPIELVKGQLYVNSDNGAKFVYTGGFFGYGFSSLNEYHNNAKLSFKRDPQNWKEPTPEQQSEFKMLITQECYKRFEQGDVVKCLKDEDLTIIDLTYYYVFSEGCVWYKNGNTEIKVFENGVFAEVVKEEEPKELSELEQLRESNKNLKAGMLKLIEKI